MTEKLEQINKKILDAETRLKEINAEIKALASSLAEKRTEQATAIVEKNPTKHIVDEVLNLQANLSGSQRAHEDLTQTLSSFREERKAELRAIGRTQAEIAKDECMKLAASIYSHFAESKRELVNLKAKKDEFRAALIAADPKTVDSKSRNISNLVYSLEKEIPKLLLDFPSEIFQDRNHPSLKICKSY